VTAQTSGALNTEMVTRTVGSASTTTVTERPTGSSASTANSAASQPSETAVSPISYSQSQVPYLLSLPETQSGSGQWLGPTFSGCDDDDSTLYADPAFRINVSAVYSQIDTTPNRGSTYGSNSKAVLRIVAIGNVANESHAFATAVDSTGATVGLLSAAGVQSNFLTFGVYSNYTFLCNQIYPKSNDSLHPNVTPSSCQYGPGQIAFGYAIPLNSTYEAGTLWTQIRLTDTSSPARTLTCITVSTSTYRPHRWFWRLILWLPVALFILFFALNTLAALATAETAQRMAFKNRAREGGPPLFVRDKLRPMLLSALAGREMIRSPALLRFATPGCWDILLHLQFLVVLAMCHVQWPDFFYPFIRQTVWASLLGNVTIVDSADAKHGLLATTATLPQGDIAAQMADSSSVLYMNSAQPNLLLNLGDAKTGAERFAAAVGLRASGLFGTCMVIWLAIVATVMIVSTVAWTIDGMFEAKYERVRRKEEAGGEISGASVHDQMLDTQPKKQGRYGTRPFESPLAAFTVNNEKNADLGKLGRRKLGHHFLALHGNLIRALVLFHLPITTFSVYQFANPQGHSTVSIILSVLAFVVFSVAGPLYIISCISRRSTEDLYNNANSMLALGPVYHMYAPGSQLFYMVAFLHSLALGVVAGAAQKSGAAQAIVILVVEVVAALASSLWLPWGDGAMMGPLNFMTGVLRIISAVLLLLLTSLVGFSDEARGWLTYVILLLQGIFFAGALLVVAVKMIEATVRVIWRVRFDERVSGRTAGLGGAMRKIRRRKLKHRKAAAAAAGVALAPVELRRSRPENHSRSTSMASMLDKGGMATPMSDMNRLSYIEYLDGHKHTRSTGAAPPGSKVPSKDAITTTWSAGSGLYDKDDSGPIMAAFPPPMSSPSQERPSFARVGGGRASETRPYSALPSNTVAPMNAARVQHRPKSVAGLTQGSTATYPPQESTTRPAMRSSGGEWTSTQAAAVAASQSLGGGLDTSKTQRKNTFAALAGRMTGGRRARVNGNDDDDDEDESTDDEEEGYGTWNSQDAADKRKPWMGAVKMSSALGRFRDALVGVRASDSDSTAVRRSDGRVAVSTQEPTEDQQATKGFEVIRKPRQGVSGTTPPPKRESLPDDDERRRASDFYPSDFRLEPVQGREQVRPRSPLDFYPSSVGILGADMQLADVSSIGHSEPAENAEERFWLPPLRDIQTPLEGDGDEGNGR
jgi:hypothetical protein